MDKELAELSEGVVEGLRGHSVGWSSAEVRDAGVGWQSGASPIGAAGADDGCIASVDVFMGWHV